MGLKNNFHKVDWQKESQNFLREACTAWGIKASLVNKDNYGAIFTRDAVMAGVAGVLLQDGVIVEAFKNTLFQLKKIQGKQGQIASNYTVREGKIVEVSFGTLSPKIDACTWYMVGVGLLIKEGELNKGDFQESVEKTIALLDAIEYNGKHLMYIPKGGNWADEYIYEGYILYDQILRAWGLSLLAAVYGNENWKKKADGILSCVDERYKDDENRFFHSSIYPGGAFKKFDLAAHALSGIVLKKDNLFYRQTLDWMFNEFIEKNKFPPAFHPIIKDTDTEWATLRNYHLYAFKNKPNHYHNGGVWWIWLGWLAVAFSLWGKESYVNRLTEMSFDYLGGREHFEFDEYVSADKLLPGGTKKLCYTATGIVFLSLAKGSFDFSKLNPTP